MANFEMMRNQRNVALPREMWIEILSKFDTFELYKKNKEVEEMIYLVALERAKVFRWQLQYEPTDLTREEFELIWGHAINEITEQLIILTQPRQIQILDTGKARNITYISLRDVELNRFIFGSNVVKCLILDNVFLGDGYVLNDILEKNKNLNEIRFRNLGTPTMYLHKNVFQNITIEKLFIDEVTAFSYKKLVISQAANLLELGITNTGIGVDHLCEYDTYDFPKLTLLEINIYEEEFGNAEMKFLENITDLHIMMESIKSLFSKLDSLIKLSPNLKRVKLKSIIYDERFRKGCREWLNCEVRVNISNELRKHGIDPEYMIRKLKYNNRFCFEL